MTGIPSRNSRTTALSRSISFWVILNFGRTIANALPMMPMITMMTSAMIHVMSASEFSTLSNAPIPMMGA